MSKPKLKKNMNKEKPSVGRIVWFYPVNENNFPFRLNEAEYLPAIVTQSFEGSDSVNLNVFTPFDGARPAMSVKQKGTFEGEDFSWDWPVIGEKKKEVSSPELIKEDLTLSLDQEKPMEKIAPSSRSLLPSDNGSEDAPKENEVADEIPYVVPPIVSDQDNKFATKPNKK